MPNLCLDKQTIFITDDSGLQVLNRRGSFRLHGKGLDSLHTQLKPYLDGSLDEETLLQAIPQNSREVVTSYLGKMKTIGALQPSGQHAEAVTEIDVPLDTLLQSPVSSIHFHLNNQRASITTDRDLTAVIPKKSEYKICLIFEQKLDEIIARIEQLTRHNGTVGILLISGVTGRRELQESFAKKMFLQQVLDTLLRSYSDIFQSETRLTVHAVDLECSTLSQLLQLVESPVEQIEFANVKDWFQLVEFSNETQLPLVNARLAAKYLDFPKQAWGLSFQKLERRLILELKSSLIRRFSDNARFQFSKPAHLTSAEERKSGLPASHNEFYVDDSLAELRLICLESFLMKKVNKTELASKSKEHDMLSRESLGNSCQLLMQILSLRLKDFTVNRYQSESGLFVYWLEDFCSYSFIEEKSCFEMLMYIVGRVYYDTRLEATDIRSAALDYVADVILNELVEKHSLELEQSYPEARFIYVEQELWQENLFMGYIG
ncbi:MAG: hypothetical protein ACRBF0_15365 [Calditrichia bacterium]